MSIIYLSNVTLSFPHLIEPQVTVTDDGNKRSSYNVDLIMEPNHPSYATFMKRWSEIALEKWKENAQAVMQMIHANRKQRCYGPGEEVINKKTFKPYDGYVDMVHIGAGCDKPPQMILPDGSKADTSNTMLYQQLARELYAGCRVNVAIKPWPQDNKKGGLGIRSDLVAIQFASKGTPFGEAPVDVTGIFGQVTNSEVQQSSTAAMPGVPSFTSVPSFLG